MWESSLFLLFSLSTVIMVYCVTIIASNRCKIFHRPLHTHSPSEGQMSPTVSFHKQHCWEQPQIWPLWADIGISLCIHQGWSMLGPSAHTHTFWQASCAFLQNDSPTYFRRMPMQPTLQSLQTLSSLSLSVFSQDPILRKALKRSEGLVSCQLTPMDVDAVHMHHYLIQSSLLLGTILSSLNRMR